MAKFPLAAVLRLREAEEEQAEQALQQAAQHMHDVESALAQVQQERQRQSSAMAKALQDGMQSAEIQWLKMCAGRLEYQIEVIANALIKARQYHAAQQIAYQKARQRREVLTTLKDQQHAAEKLADSRKQQSQADEMFLLRSVRERG
jgi:flagellar export protein FliJ